MNINQPENKMQQQIVQGLRDKIKEALGDQVQVAPVKIQGMDTANEKQTEELEVMKKKIESQMLVLNEIKEALDKLNRSVANLSKTNQNQFLRRLR